VCAFVKIRVRKTGQLLPTHGWEANFVTLLVDQEPSGIAIVRRDGEMNEGDRSELRKVVYKLIAQCPAAIIIDLTACGRVPPLIQMTLLAMAVEAAREPATPLLLCAPDAEVARSLALNGPMMRVYPGVVEARRSLVAGPHGNVWIQQRLGRTARAADIATEHLWKTCSQWQIPWMQAPASSVAYDLVRMARGPFDLHMTVSLRPERHLLINVRNYVMADLSQRQHGRLKLNPKAETQLLGHGAVACGQLITGAGVAWWANLDCRPPPDEA
jgi:hypothetical protein